MKPTARPDTWEVQGRGELQLAVLVETMRREGFELTVGKPQVVTREVDGSLHEPIERLAIDMPEDFLGVVTQMLALRKGRMEQMVNHGTGWVRLEFLVPARGLIGFRTEFLTETRGTGHPALGLRALRALAGRDPDAADRLARGRPPRRHRHVRAAEAAGAGAAVRGPGRGGLRGHGRGRERALRRPRRERGAREEADQHARVHGSDEPVRLAPHHQLSLDQALEFIREDECVEVTPAVVRLRKVELDAGVRQKLARGSKPDPVAAG